jgi:hypothetical protein
LLLKDSKTRISSDLSAVEYLVICLEFRSRFSLKAAQKVGSMDLIWFSVEALGMLLCALIIRAMLFGI